MSKFELTEEELKETEEFDAWLKTPQGQFVLKLCEQQCIKELERPSYMRQLFKVEKL